MDSEPAVEFSPLMGRGLFPLPTTDYSHISPKSVFVGQRANLTPEALRYWGRWIRDVLAPLLARESHASLSEDNLSAFLIFFADLRYTPVTVDSLRNSRIHSALGHIVEQKVRWPDWIVQEAQELLQDWEKDLGSLRSIKADLWGPGGRLEGVKELEEWQDSIMWGNNFACLDSSDVEAAPKKMPRGFVNKKESEDSPGPYVIGSNGATVGEWVALQQAPSSVDKCANPRL